MKRPAEQQRAIGVCSWSLRPGTAEQLLIALAGLKIDTVQLDLSPIVRGQWDMAHTRSLLDRAGVRIASGMLAFEHEDYTSLESIARTGGFTPDEHWPRCLAELGRAAAVAGELKLDLLTLHAGHLPPPSADGSLDRVMLGHLREAADVLGERRIRLGLETGQESAETLLAYLDELPDVAVNFDPANMILYGMGAPIEALERLAPRVAQIHIKDAVGSATPGTWGTEVRVGEGEVDWPRFLATSGERCPGAPMMIEREAGNDRAADIAAAAKLLRRLRESPA